MVHSPFLEMLEIGGKRITTMDDFTVCVSGEDVKLDVAFHVAKEDDILYTITLENDIFEKVVILVNLLAAKFTYRSKPALDNGEIISVVELQREFNNILCNDSGDRLDTEHLSKTN